MFKIISKLIRYPNRFLIKLKFLKQKKLNDKFSIIYKKNYWDDQESISGPGSSLKKYKKFKINAKKNT